MLESTLVNPPRWSLIHTPTGASDEALLMIRSRSFPAPSTSRAITNSPPSSAVRSRELAAPGAVESSTIRYRKPLGPRPSGSTTTKLWRRSRRSFALPRMGVSDVPTRAEASEASDARQLAANANSAGSASNGRQRKRARRKPATLGSGEAAIPTYCLFPLDCGRRKGGASAPSPSAPQQFQETILRPSLRRG